MSLRALISGLAIASTLTVLPAAAQTAPFNDAQRDAIRAIIKDYILKNPEIVQEALVELDKRQKESEQQSRLRITQDKTGPLFTARLDGIFGNPAGNVTIVEFFDYNCGFCKRALGDLQKIVAEDKNVRIITKDFPVLGSGSLEAATVALASSFPPKRCGAFTRSCCPFAVRSASSRRLMPRRKQAPTWPASRRTWSRRPSVRRSRRMCNLLIPSA